MIIYNVTINIPDELHDEWLLWMKQTHLPDVMNTGMFTSYRMLKLLTRQPDEVGTTYAIQYNCPTKENYDRYAAEFGPALQTETRKKFGETLLAFRTLLEEV